MSNSCTQAFKLFIGGISGDTNKNDLKNYFSQYGTIVDSVIMIDKSTKHSRGFGFISMESKEQINAVLNSQPHIINGKKVECKIAIPKEHDEKEENKHKDFTFFQDSKVNKDQGISYDFEPSIFQRKIFVGGLHQMSTENDMFNYFSQFGEVEQAMIMKDKSTGKSRGFGFVIFTNTESVDHVINCRHSHYLLGKWIECKRATPKEFTQSKRVFHEEKETVKQNNNQCLFAPIIQINNLIQTNNNNTNFYFPYMNHQENYPSYFYNNVNNKEEVKGSSNTINVNRNQSSLITSSQSESDTKDELNLSNDSIYQKKPESSNTFSNYFNEHMKNPLCNKYFHYKLFDTSGEEINGLTNSYKTQSKMKLFDEEKLSPKIFTKESIPLFKKQEENAKNEDDEENCFGPKRRRMNCFSSNGFFTPY